MTRAFAGPLCRFYARRGGDPVRLRAGVERWRSDLLDALPAKLRAAATLWDEGAEPEAEVDLGPSGLAALRLFALYAEKTELELPDTVPPLLELDREWRTASDAKFATSKYGQLLACSLWLPGDSPVTVRAPLPDGEDAEIGSLAVLRDQLRFLLARTFQADEAEVASWRDEPAPTGGPLLPAARHGFASLSAAAAAAARATLPLSLDLEAP